METFNQNYKVKNSNSLYFIVLISAVFFEYVRPQDNFLSFISPLKIPSILMLLMFIIFVKEEKKYLSDRLSKCSLAFIIIMLISIPYAINNFHAYRETKVMFLVFFTFVFPLIAIIKTKGEFIRFFEYWIIIQFIVALYVIKNGGRGTGSFSADENDACLVLNMALPYAFYFSLRGDISFKKKLFYRLSFLVILTAIVMTSSRGGFLGMIAAIGMFIILSKDKFKNLLKLSILSLCLGGVVLSALPDGYLDDMNTISNTEDSTRNLRLLHWTTGWEIFKDNPILGVGAGNYPWNSTSYFHLSPYYKEGARNRSGRQAHSLYFTLIPEMGLAGISIFVVMCLTIYSRVNGIRKVFNRNDNEVLLANAIGASLVSYLVTGAFVSVLYYPLFWHLTAFAILLPIIFKYKKSKETSYL